MMMRSLPVRSPYAATPFLDSRDLQGTASSSTRISCCSRSTGSIPKLEPFSRTKFDRVVKDPPLIQKCENDIADYCLTLDGDASNSCWRAYFALKELEEEFPKEDVESLIIQSGGIKSLIGCLHGISDIHKAKKERHGSTKALGVDEMGPKPCPIPDGLPKSQEEIEEEEKGRMPDSPFTRLLRTKGRFPAWYSPAPDHETD